MTAMLHHQLSRIYPKIVVAAKIEQQRISVNIQKEKFVIMQLTSIALTMATVGKRILIIG